jgi:hypothetical protein
VALFCQSILYYESVRRALGDISHAYRMFPVPGMGQCATSSCFR